MSNTLLIRIQYGFQFKYSTDLIKTMRRMINEIWNEITKLQPVNEKLYITLWQQKAMKIRVEISYLAVGPALFNDLLLATNQQNFYFQKKN